MEPNVAALGHPAFTRLGPIDKLPTRHSHGRRALASLMTHDVLPGMLTGKRNCTVAVDQ
jgi:hypothetical protein